MCENSTSTAKRGSDSVTLNLNNSSVMPENVLKLKNSTLLEVFGLIYEKYVAELNSFARS